MDHQHTLQLNGSELPSFMCSGCKEQGAGTSYICEYSNCNYILHKECAESVKHAVHPFFKNCNFELYEKAEEGGFCDACGKDLLGFYYASSITGCALHPCCLNLKENILNDDGNVIMTLSHEVPSDCVHCKQKHVVRNQFEGWSYVFNSDGKSCVHVSCFKDMIPENLKKRPRRRRMRSFMKFTGKLVVNIAIDLITGDITNSISTIVEALARSNG
ncbi:uncharacterized protein LOC123891479 [Trifolium pratense]|uniref:uncharacterized protein LOC123891479 n=1 Tax=Trifolium pratense TaxID=57577 RepID=UPI001E697E3B|nr:uncharacterized protein LOC123891479 [Trifolium pratense]